MKWEGEVVMRVSKTTLAPTSCITMGRLLAPDSGRCTRPHVARMLLCHSAGLLQA